MGLERNVFFTGLTSFFTDTSIKMVYSVMPLFLMSIGREKLIIAGFLVYSVVYYLFGRYNNISVFIGLFVLYGLYSALVDGSQKAMISDLVSKNMKGTGFGIYHAILGMTLLPASLIAGILYDKVNTNAPFYFGSAIALTAAILMIIFTIYYHKPDLKK